MGPPTFHVRLRSDRRSPRPKGACAAQFFMDVGGGMGDVSRRSVRCCGRSRSGSLHPSIRNIQEERTMIDHTGVGVSDYARSLRFYAGALAPIGYTLIMEVPREHTGGVGVAGFGVAPKPDFWIH